MEPKNLKGGLQRPPIPFLVYKLRCFSLFSSLGTVKTAETA